MKKMILRGIFFIGICTLLQSCYYDNEERLYPQLKCDTTNVTYSQTIAPIMNTNCIVCHNTTSSQGGVIVSTWAGLNTVALNGKLIPAVDHTGPFPMPKIGGILSDCTIDKIRIWVQKGALNN